MSSSIPANPSPWFCESNIQRSMFFVDGCIGVVFNLICVTSKEVDLVKCLKMDASLCIRKNFNLGKSTKDGDVRLCAIENRREKKEK